MRKDQIFVLMLVILLPMSGCFDGAMVMQKQMMIQMMAHEWYHDVIRTVLHESRGNNVVNMRPLMVEHDIKINEGWKQYVTC